MTEVAGSLGEAVAVTRKLQIDRAKVFNEEFKQPESKAMKIKPLGFYVLVEVDKVSDLSEGGIIALDKDVVAREQEAKDFGKVLAIGPIAYLGFRGCEDTGAEGWGVKVGDKVEFRRYEGKLSAQPDVENHRYIPDSHILGVINE